MLIFLNTGALLKRASLERKKSDGAYRTLYSLAPLGFALGLHSPEPFVLQYFFFAERGFYIPIIEIY